MSMSTRRPPYQYSSFQDPSGNVHIPSPRSSYPSFLSLQDSLVLQLKWAWRGLYDAFRWNVVISAVSGDSEIRASVYKSLLLNSLSLVSIYAFDLLLSPLQNQQSWFHRNIGWFYQVLWLFPVVGVSLYLNNSWCSTIAKRTFTLQHGTRAHQQPMTYSGMLTAIATSAYRVVMVFNSVGMSSALQNIPYIGPVAGFIFLCWVDSYYCFEFVWVARGLSLSGRIRHLEERWAYYLAFGLPSAALCTLGTGLANAAIFALVFPAYIILAMDAHPMPKDPYNPLPPSGQGGEQDVIRHPSPFVPIRLPIFALVIRLNDIIVWILSAGPVGKRAPVRSRAFSDAAESAEEGDTAKLKRAGPARPAVNRIQLSRRKFD